MVIVDCSCHRGLLRARGERPRRRGAAQQRDEVPLVLTELHAIPHDERGRTAGYRVGSDRSAGIPASPDGSAPSYVVTEAAVEPHAVAVLARYDAEAVVLDLVQPRLAGWR